MRLAAGALICALLLATAGCSGDGDGEAVAEVRLQTPTPSTPTGAPGLPTPTPVPPPELILSTREVYQAGAVLASLTGEVSSGRVTFLGRQHDLTRGTQSIYAFLGVPIEAEPGPHQLRIEFTMVNGSRGSLTETIDVLPVEWTVEYLQLTGEQSALLAPEVVLAEAVMLAEVYGRRTPRKLWEGAWGMPVAGAVTAIFGEQRSINGGPPSGHHGGTDFGAIEGTPVLAVNSGVVAMAKALRVRGDMVIIDHGGGLFSGYGHLSSFAASEGQTVTAGQVIGYVGNSGLSTGAHLHWEMSAGSILVDGLRFADGTNGF